MSGNDAARLREDERGRVMIEELTLAIMHHYGYTDADIAEAGAIHPGRICREDECYDEDGESIHPPAYDELHLTANLMAEVVEPYVTARLDAAEAALRDRDAAVGRVRALVPSICWISRTEGIDCTAFVGSEFGSGTWVEEMCCLPCRLRAALAAVQQPDETVEHNERCCMIGVPVTAGPHPDCPGIRAMSQQPDEAEGAE